MDLVGGQAVIEGVMMRQNQNMAIAVRLENGDIVTKKETIRKLPNFLNWPFVRGITNMLDLMVIGLKALTWSANQSMGEDEKLSNWEIFWTLAVSLLFSIVFFVGLPFFLTWLTGTTGFTFNAIDGVLRLSVFLLYVYLIAKMNDIRRVFQYHGAEHKCVNTYEAGDELTVENVKKHSVQHPRCGTTFLVIVMLISIAIFSFIITDNIGLKLLWRIILIPVIASVSYELLKVSWKFKENIIFKTMIKPGLWTQKLTTREPDDQQIEVGIVALKAALQHEHLGENVQVV